MTVTDIWHQFAPGVTRAPTPAELAQGLYPKVYPPASENGVSQYETAAGPNPRFRPVNTARNDVVRRELTRPRGDC